MSLAANDPARIVIHAFSASKISFPDNRVAWMHLPMEWENKDLNGNYRNLFSEITSAVAAGILIHCSRNLAGFNGQMWERDLPIGLALASGIQSQIYRKNLTLLYDSLFDGLQKPYPDLFQLTPRPLHGFVFSLILPELSKKTRFNNVSLLAQHLMQHYNVIVTPMSGFTPPDLNPCAFDHIMRLSFSFESPDRIFQGSDRLIGGIKQAFSL